MIIHSFALDYLGRKIGETQDCKNEVNGIDCDHVKPEGYFGYSNLVESKNCELN